MFDIATKYWLSLDKNNDKSLKLFLLLSYLEKYVNGAIIEMNRLEKTRRNIIKGLSSLKNIGAHRKPRNKDFQLTYLACDTHFFFICIDKCHKLINQLSLELNDKDVEKLKVRLNKIFDIKTVRNHLEHIEKRCIGYLSRKDEKKKKLKQIQDFGNFIGDNFSFNNKKFQSNRKSLEELKNIYRELIKILHDKYASKDPRFIERIAQEKRIELIQKVFKKAGLV
jgi:hypothetical protein